MLGGTAAPRQHQKLKEETRLVLEAFLQGTLCHGARGAPGHVGRSYHDPQRYTHRHPSEHAKECPAWSLLHEEINRVEERKHGFRTTFKHLLCRSSPSRLPEPLHPPGETQKRAKGAEAGDGARRKHSRSISIKSLLRKKGAPPEEKDSPTETPLRPDSLPVEPCYCGGAPASGCGAEDPDFYVRVAQRLDWLVKQQQLISPTAAKGVPSPGVGAGPLSADSGAPSSSSHLGEKNPAHLEGTSPEAPSQRQKEQVMEKLVALLEEQAGVINEEIEADPLLRRTLARLSYRSFSRLAEAFVSRSPVGVASPQLAKLALTMELTRKVAGINSHAVHTLMGYSLQYMDMFIPWLQQQGGWESIVTQGEIFDLQLD